MIFKKLIFVASALVWSMSAVVPVGYGENATMLDARKIFEKKSLNAEDLQAIVSILQEKFDQNNGKDLCELKKLLEERIKLLEHEFYRRYDFHKSVNSVLKGSALGVFYGVSLMGVGKAYGWKGIGLIFSSLIAFGLFDLQFKYYTHGWSDFERIEINDLRKLSCMICAENIV
jgi:hypothetical protein